MAVLMAKCERFRQAYSDYKHLSSDNLSFVAGLRGRPVPAPVADLGRPTAVRRRPKGTTPKDKEEEGADEDSGGIDDEDSSIGTQTPRQACPGRACAPRGEVLEAMVEKRASAQTARHKAQIKLNLARERSQEAETKLEETKAELVRMTQAITEGDERTESLHDTLRNEGSVNKAIAEELDVLLVEAMSLRRQFAVDTLPPRPNTPIVPPPDDDDDKTPAYQEDGRALESPTTAPGQKLLEQHQAAKEGAGGAHSGMREWVHSGRLGDREIFTRPPRPTNNVGAAGGTATIATAAGAQNRAPGGVDFSASSSSSATAVPGWDESGDNRNKPGWGVGAEMASDRAGGKSRSEAEGAWSCCGKTVVSGGRGCEPREPVATPEDLLLDTMDPRSRLGQRLDFREFLPHTAWMGLTPDPVRLFAGSPSEGTLRPHTAPERLMDTPGQWNPLGEGGSNGSGGRGAGEGEYQRRAARSRNGGLIGGVWASGGRRKGNAGLSTGQGRLGGVSPFSLSRGSGVNALGGSGTVGQWGSTAFYAGVGGGGIGGRFPKRHEFLRRSRPDDTMATHPRSRGATHNGSVTRFPTPGGHRVAGRGGTASAVATAVDEFWPRTQILGMNGGRLPRQVRQAPADRPLTAPCGKVGRRRVRTRGGSRGAAARP